MKAKEMGKCVTLDYRIQQAKDEWLESKLRPEHKNPLKDKLIDWAVVI